MNAIKYLGSLSACHEAQRWARSRPAKRQTLAALWADCPRGDWMLWLAARVPSPDLNGIVAAAHACAMLAHDYAAACAPTDAYDSAAAADTTDAYAASAADYAAHAAPSAAAAAAAAAVAAAYAASARSAAAATYAVHAATYAKEIARHQCADLVRMLVRRPVMS